MKFFVLLGNYENTSENPFFYLWISSAVVSSLYSYIWDIKMDWGFFDQNAGENKFLRAEVVYSSKVSTTVLFFFCFFFCFENCVM
jgi:hypothetical protein